MKSKKKDIEVIKASGDKVPFDESKLITSLSRSGATDEMINNVIDQVRKVLYNGITTNEIYKEAFDLLKKESRPHAARYHLKRAIYAFGPTGFPFERFIGAVLAGEGFDTRVSVIIKGKCVKHEVDVVAEKGGKHYMVECKFHHERGITCNVKVPLYIHSRFRDIDDRLLKERDQESRFHQGWIFTNTRFTSDAIQFAKCVGLQLVGWNYPKSDSLNKRIDRLAHYEAVWNPFAQNQVLGYRRHRL